MKNVKLVSWTKRLLRMIYTQLLTCWMTMIGRAPKVRWLNWEVTDACNSRCKLCNIWKQKPNPNMMTLEEIKKAFSDPLFKDLEYIILTGGEPVIRNDLVEIILSIHKLIPKVAFTLSTNALLPDRVIEVVKTAIDNGVCLDVGVSLDGIGAHHDEVRGVKGNYEKVDRLIKELIKLRETTKVPFEIVAGQTIHSITIDYMNEVKQYAEKMGISYLDQLFDEAPFYYNVGDTSMSLKADQKMIGAISSLLPSFHNEVLLRILRDKKIKFDCFALRSFFILRCDGEVMPCLSLCDVGVGNIRNASPSEVWSGEKAKTARKMVKNCQGCSNTWATDWSLESNFIPFTGLLVSVFIKRFIR